MNITESKSQLSFPATKLKIGLLQSKSSTKQKRKRDDLNSITGIHDKSSHRSDEPMTTRYSNVDGDSSSEPENDSTSFTNDQDSPKRDSVRKASWEAIQDIHNNNKDKEKEEHLKLVPKDLLKNQKMSNDNEEEHNLREKTLDIVNKTSPSTSSPSPPIPQFVNQANNAASGIIPKPLGLRIPQFQGNPPPIPPHHPLFPHQPQRPSFFPWLYSQHTSPTSPMIGNHSFNPIQPSISSSNSVSSNVETSSALPTSRFLPPPFPPILPPTLMHLNIPTAAGGVDLSNVFPPGMPLGRGHELMRRLCAMNPQFASSVLEDYIRPQVRDGDIVLEIECGPNAALLYLSRLCQGSKGPCIWFQDAWLTPNEFQYVSGRETAKDWKRSIRHCGKSMKLLLTKGILTTHPPICDCDGCRISSPVVSHGINTNDNTFINPRKLHV